MLTHRSRLASLTRVACQSIQDGPCETISSFYKHILRYTFWARKPEFCAIARESWTGCRIFLPALLFPMWTLAPRAVGVSRVDQVTAKPVEE